MRPVSEQFLNALRGSGLATARVRPCLPSVRGGDGLIAPAGPALPILDGKVTLDGTADERGRLDLTVAPYWPDTGQDRPSTAGSFSTSTATATMDTRPGKPVWPNRPSDPLTPYGKVLLVEAGVEYGNGNVEYVRLGYFRVDEMTQDDEPEGPIVISGRDLMAFLVDSRMIYEATFLAGTTYQHIFETLVIEGTESFFWNGLPFGFTTTDLDLDSTFGALTLGVTSTTEQDRFAFLNTLVKDAGYVWYFDGRGKCVVKEPPDPMTPVWTIGGTDGGALRKASRKITREGVYTIIVADSAAIQDTPSVRYVLANNTGFDDPVYYAAFGYVPRFYESPFITNDAQAESAARKLLPETLVLPYQRAITHTPNPALEPGDPVTVWAHGTNDPLSSELQIVETTEIPLVPGQDATSGMREGRIVV